MGKLGLEVGMDIAVVKRCLEGLFNEANPG